MTSFSPGKKSKGAPGLAFETWDPCNLSRRAVDRSPMETPTLPFVIPTRISCRAALDKSRVRLSLKERRMRFANATKFNRKSGGAQPTVPACRGGICSSLHR
jgi:hypothetical protein